VARCPVATLAVRCLTAGPGAKPDGVGPVGVTGGISVGRFVRLTIRMLLVSAALTGLIRIGRTIFGRPSGGPGDGAIRTGSFDKWPKVPVAPGRPHPGN
jgi:hypothetical protein